MRNDEWQDEDTDSILKFIDELIELKQIIEHNKESKIAIKGPFVIISKDKKQRAYFCKNE